MMHPGSYAAEVAALQDVQEAVSALDTCLLASETKAATFSTTFQKFSRLWSSDLQASLLVNTFMVRRSDLSSLSGSRHCMPLQAPFL